MLSVAVGRWARRQVVVARNDERQANIARIDGCVGWTTDAFCIYVVCRTNRALLGTLLIHRTSGQDRQEKVLEAFAWELHWRRDMGFWAALRCD